MFSFRYSIYLMMTISRLFSPLRLFRRDRQPKAENVDAKCYNASNLIN